jgi:hypothetical protein
LVLNPFARRRIYFRFDENEVHAVVLRSDRSYRERALVALKREGVARKVLAIGNDVLIAEASARELGTSGIEVINPFGTHAPLSTTTKWQTRCSDTCSTSSSGKSCCDPTSLCTRSARFQADSRQSRSEHCTTWRDRQAAHASPSMREAI